MSRTRWLSIALFGVVAACAPQRAEGPKLGYLQEPKELRPGCPARTARDDLSSQKAEVDAALQGLVQKHKSDLARLRQDTSGPSGDEDARFDELTDAYDQARTAILVPLAARGNADAMVRLADSDFRESADPVKVDRWFALTTCAAGLGHPTAFDESVRWYWHQRGDGSIGQVQANRATALAFANRAALAGNMFAISRVATYIAGNIHQYPVNLLLGQRLMRLCAETGDRGCEEFLAGDWVYDPGLTPAEAYRWRSLAANSEPERFADRRDLAWAKLTAEERVAAIQTTMTWRPTSWRNLQNEWKAIEADILDYGQTSTGVLPSCGTERPWCRTVSTRISVRLEADR
jgi:hypothetical protein